MDLMDFISNSQSNGPFKMRNEETLQEYIRRLGEVSDLDSEEIEDVVNTVNEYQFAPDDAVTEKEVREQLEYLINGISTADAESQSADLSSGKSSKAEGQGDLQSHGQQDETTTVNEDKVNGPAKDTNGRVSSAEQSPTDFLDQNRTQSSNWRTSFSSEIGRYISNISLLERVLILRSDEWSSRSHNRSNFPLIVNNPTDANLVRILRYFPLFLLLTVLTVPLTIHHPAVEFGHYFQSIAFLDDGLWSYTYLTPQESLAGLHLYSILAAPLIAIGYTVGGRLVSFLAALGTSVIAAKIAREEFDEVNYLFVPVLLWANSFFVFFASAIGPNVLSIFLTTTIIYTTLVSFTCESNYWMYATVVLLVLAILNHGWEATIALPIFVLYVFERRYIHAATISVVTVISVGILQFGTALQSTKSGTAGYSVLSSGLSIYLDPTWWTPHLQWPFPLGHTTVLLFIGSIAFVFWWGAIFVRTRSRRSIMMTSWLLSGLSIPVILPLGYTAHMYYLWALVVPFTLSLGAVVKTSYQLINAIMDKVTAQRIVSGLMVVLFLLNVVVVGSFHAGLFDTPGLQKGKNKGGVVEAPNSEAIRAGEQLADKEIEDPSDIVFVGNWKATYAGGLYKPSQILAYAGINVKHAWKINDRTIRIAAPNESVGSCEAMVRLVVNDPADSPFTNELIVEDCEE